jgi:LEA14-like dessication related protein
MNEIFSRRLLALTMFGLLSACATVPPADAPEVTVAGIESLPGEGLEMRMLVKLRVQNPNDAPINYNGAFLKLAVQNRNLASGVSADTGTVPRFGEAVIGVPVTISTLRVLRQVLGLLDGQPIDKVSYTLTGKLNGTGFRSLRFNSKGEFSLPTAGAPAGTRLD